MEDKYYFEDEEGYIWSVTKEEIIRDAKDYEKDSGETIDDPFQFFLDNFDESIANFELVERPGDPQSPKHRRAVMIANPEQ